MIHHVGSSLADIAYILEEPSVGLHPFDRRPLNTLLRGPSDEGNTVLAASITWM